MAEQALLGHRIDFMVEYCYNCNIPFAFSRDFYNRAQEKGKDKLFYCPNGHGQFYRESKVQKLEKELAAKNRQIEEEREHAEREIRAKKSAQRSAAVYRGQVTKVKNRIKNGVCPCCNRSFENLRRHMATKHPKFSGLHSV